MGASLSFLMLFFHAVVAPNLQAESMQVLKAHVETQQVSSPGDAADDTAIFVDEHDPLKSVVIATDKKRGLLVYDLSGKRLQELAHGRMNNVDLRPHVNLAGKSLNLVAAGERNKNQVRLYHYDAVQRQLVPLEHGAFDVGLEIYGSCLYRSPKTGQVSVFVDDKEGNVIQWLLKSEGHKFVAETVRHFDVGGQVEGCVADDQNAFFYVAEEDVGIWRYGAESNAGSDRVLIDDVKAGHLRADIEGIALHRHQNGKQFLLASSQGDNSIAVYHLGAVTQFRCKFQMQDPTGNFLVRDTDGIEVVSNGLSSPFEGGLLVLQDGNLQRGHQRFQYAALKDLKGCMD